MRRCLFASMKPRRRYFASVSTGLALLFVLGGVLHYTANRGQRRALESRLDALERDLASKQDRCAVEPLSAEGNEPHSGESVGGYPTGPVLIPPRILGSGRSGAWLYTDVRYGDGEQRRYYVRTNATPLQVRSFISSLASDAREHAAYADD